MSDRATVSPIPSIAKEEHCRFAARTWALEQWVPNASRGALNKFRAEMMNYGSERTNASLPKTFAICVQTPVWAKERMDVRKTLFCGRSLLAFADRRALAFYGGTHPWRGAEY